MFYFLNALVIAALVCGSLNTADKAQEQTSQAGQAQNGCDHTLLERAQTLSQKEDASAQKGALELYQQNLGCFPSAPAEEKAGLLLNIGRIHARLHDSKKALESFSSALEALQEIADPPPEVRQKKAAVVVNLARILGGLGRIDEALPFQKQALDLFTGLDDQPGEAYTLGEIGRTYFLMGDYQAALLDYALALDLRNAMNPGDLINQRFKAALLDLTGRVYARMNATGMAQMYFGEALGLARKTNYHTFAAYALNDLGALLLGQNLPQVAEKNHQAALVELLTYTPEDKEGIAETQTMLGDAQTALGEHAIAKKNYETALVSQHDAGDVIGEAQTRFSIGMAELAGQRPEAALNSLRQSATLYHGEHEREGESNALYQMARSYAALGDFVQAKNELQNAIHLGEEIRSLTPGRALRTAYFVSVEKMYRFEIDLILGQGATINPADQLLALELLQRAQARSLAEALARKSGDSPTLPTGESRSLQEPLLRELERQQQKLFQSRTKSAFRAETLSVVAGLKASLEADYDAPGGPPPGMLHEELDIAGLQQGLERESVLIQFYLADPASYAWVISQSAFSFVRLPAGPELEKKVRAILKFGDAGLWTNAQQAAVKELRLQLDPLFAIVHEKRWMVVPDGLLHNLAFALLAAPGPQEIMKIPSIAALNIVRKRPYPKQPSRTLAIFADPVFDRFDSRVLSAKGGLAPAVTSSAKEARSAGLGDSFPRLRYSRDEFQQIASLVPPDETRSFLGFAARPEAAAGHALEDFRIIHLATHSLTDDRHPEFSRIVFSLVNRDGSPRPGFLMLKDIYRMNLSSDLIVLSSCRGALGKQQAGEGPASLARAFLFAGSRAVVATLWEVDDQATAAVMARFYQHMLRDHLPPLAALARTQNEFRHHPLKRLRNPYYWAGVEMYGD